MKKFYLFLSSVAMITSAFSQAQMSLPAGATFGPSVKTSRSNVFIDNDTKTGTLAKPKSKVVSGRGANLSSFVRIGSTYYDLQSNYSTSHRAVMHKNQSISAAWTTSYSGAQGFPGRGTGYNFRTTAGVWGKSDSSRVENVRTGWPCIGVLSNGNVFTIGHDATNGGFYMTVSTSNDARPSVTTSILQDAPYKPIWARAASNGDTIHLICSYTDSAAPGEKRAPTRKGIFAPMVYSRSLDGGKNWDIKHRMLPDYDSTLTDNGGADQYNIDVKGNNVAIVNSDLFMGTVVWKSADFGNNWKRFDAMKFKYAPYKSKTLMNDTPFTADGTCDVLIDNSGKVHAFWGLSRVIDDDTTDTQFSFFPGYQGLMYWNEDMDTIVNTQGAPSLIKDGFDQLSSKGLDSGKVQTGEIGIPRYITQGNMLMNFGWDTTSKYWSGNWALSYVHNNKIEESNKDKQLFSAITGTGAKNSEKIFAIGQNNAKLTSLNPRMLGVTSMEITNSTYAYNSMKLGDSIAKKFNAADKDSSILVISTFMKGQKMESKRVVLADFRFLDTTKNFLLGTWQKVNFTQTNDSVTFEMVSSDNDSLGMNTPAFFAMDNLEVLYAAEVKQTLVNRNKVIADGASFDNTGDGVNSLRPSTTAALASGKIPTTSPTAARLGNTSALRSPNAGIDSSGNIFCAFSLPIEEDLSDLDANFRDLGIVYSKDGGKNWGTPQNITQSLLLEDDYGSIARDVNDFVHVVWQQDDIPGTNLQNNDPIQANHDVVLNKILYQAIPVKDIFDEVIGLANVDEPNTGEVLIVNQNYPNPFDNTTSVMVWLTRPGDVKIEVRNMMGAIVKNQTYSNLFKGNHELTIDGSDLTSGVYTYTLIAGGNSVSKTMMVK